ncbi:MAG: cell division protein ZapB [Candidatus Azotimanducaceae bacterium]
MGIQELEQKIDDLIQVCESLEKKHAVLEADKDNWAQERNRLLEKNLMAKNKVEAMIMRLKSLEQD